MFRRDLQGLLKREKDDLVQWLVRWLQHGPVPHYRAADPAVLTRKVQDLVESLISSTGRQSLTSGIRPPFLSYIEQIGAERISEGLTLKELQLVLTKLEERTWHLIIHYRAADELVEALCQATHLIGMAKDHLACVLLQRAGNTVAPENLSRDDNKELFKGTVCAPIIEDDDDICRP